MATITYTVTVDDETNKVTVSPTSRRDITPNSTVNFVAHNFNTSSCTLSGFSSAHFTNTSSVTLAAGGTVSKTIKASPTYSNGQVTASKSGYTSGYAYYAIVADIDTTPDSFDLGPDHTGINPSTRVPTLQITVNGVSQAVTASVTNCLMSVNYADPTTINQTVNNGDVIRCYIDSSTSYGGVVTGTLQVGGTSDSVTVTNKANPDSGETLLGPFTSTHTTLREIGDFFGFYVDVAWQPLPYQLSHYLRGGDFVPDIAANNSVPTVLPVNLLDFVGAGTSLYFETSPPSRHVNSDTTSSAQTMSAQWVIKTDFSTGYGSGMDDVVEIKYSVSVTETPSGRTASEITKTSPSGSYSTYSTSNTSLVLEANAPYNSEGTFKGTVTVYCRHPDFPTQEITSIAYFTLNYYGP